MASRLSFRLKIQYKAQIREVKTARKEPRASSNCKFVIAPLVEMIHTPAKLISKAIKSRIRNFSFNRMMLKRANTIAQV